MVNHLNIDTSITHCNTVQDAYIKAQAMLSLLHIYSTSVKERDESSLQYPVLRDFFAVYQREAALGNSTNTCLATSR